MNSAAKLGDDLGETLNLLRSVEFAPQYRRDAEQTPILWAIELKKRDLDGACEMIRKHHDRLKSILQQDTIFYEQECPSLRNKCWFVQEKLQGQFRGELFVNYGYKNDGSRFLENTEAVVLRSSVNDANSETQLISSHSSYSFCFLGIVKGLKYDPNYPSKINTNTRLVDILLNSRRNCFEKELYQKIRDDIMSDKLLMNKCQFEQQKIVIPLRNNYSIVCQLIQEVDYCDDVLMMGENIDCTLLSWNASINAMARKTLLSNFSKLKKFGKEQSIGQKIIQFADLHIVEGLIDNELQLVQKFLKKLCFTRVDKKSTLDQCDWQLLIVPNGPDKLELKITLTEKLGITLVNQNSHNSLSTSSIKDLITLVLLNTRDFFISCCYWESVCFLGKENVMYAKNGGIQVLINNEW